MMDADFLHSEIFFYRQNLCAPDGSVENSPGCDRKWGARDNPRPPVPSSNLSKRHHGSMRFVADTVHYFLKSPADRKKCSRNGLE